MTAASPVLPGINAPEVVYAKDQPPYRPLPAIVNEEGTVLVRWHLTWRERLKLLLTGNLWHYILTFNNPLQPIRLTVDKPEAC